MRMAKRGVISAVIMLMLGGVGTAQADEADMVFWQAVSTSKDGAEYCAYLQAYPAGKFAPLARVRAAKYGGSCATASITIAPKAAAPAKQSAGPVDFFTSENYYQGKRAFDAGDYKTAVKFWQESANQGAPEAQFFMGSLHHGGFGVPKDYAKAMVWYMKAAEKGDAQAQLGIGNLYGDGLGVEKDYVKARMWFSIAGERGNDRADYNAKKVAQRMSEAEIAKADKLALEWIKAHQ